MDVIWVDLEDWALRAEVSYKPTWESCRAVVCDSCLLNRCHDERQEVLKVLLEASFDFMKHRVEDQKSTEQNLARFGEHCVNHASDWIHVVFIKLLPGYQINQRLHLACIVIQEDLSFFTWYMPKLWIIQNDRVEEAESLV